jgi:hypothetical protein
MKVMSRFVTLESRGVSQPTQKQAISRRDAFGTDMPRGTRALQSCYFDAGVVEAGAACGAERIRCKSCCCLAIL